MPRAVCYKKLMKVLTLGTQRCDSYSAASKLIAIQTISWKSYSGYGDRDNLTV